MNNQNKKLYIFIGASSVITQSIAQKYAMQGHHIILAGRKNNQHEAQVTALKSKGAASVDYLELDTKNFAQHAAFFNQIVALHTAYKQADMNIFVLSAIMPSQEEMTQDTQLAVDCIEVGLTGIVSILQKFIPYFQTHKAGNIVLFGSVAGDRGRLKNYVYGATKAGLACYASGLRNQLGRSNVHVMLVKPGFMNTPMIKGMKLPPLPIAEPEDVARQVIKSLEKKRNVIYVPRFWRLIMWVISLIPECIFKKMSI